MSTERALVITTVIIFAALVLAWQGLRIWQANQLVADALAEELDPDHTPGCNAGWHDECELIWATPARELDEEGQP